MMRKMFIVTIISLTCGMTLAQGIGDLLGEMKELDERKKELKTQVEEKFKAALPSGKQSYGEFEWSCNAGSFVSISAKNSDGKQQVWAHVFFHPEMTESERKGFSKTCAGHPAKRFKDKWAWVLVGRIEIRLGISNKDLESDATIDAIFESFNLDLLKKQ